MFFFFSSRRRHTRYIGDWSSDVCSSDLDSSNVSLKHVVVTTTLSGGGQSGASITVGLGVPVTDQATLTKVKGQGDDVEDEEDDGEPVALPNDETSSIDAEDATSSAQENANNKNKNGTIAYE